MSIESIEGLCDRVKAELKTLLRHVSLEPNLLLAPTMGSLCHLRVRVIARGTLNGFVRNRVDAKHQKAVKAQLDAWYAEAAKEVSMPALSTTQDEEAQQKQSSLLTRTAFMRTNPNAGVTATMTRTGPPDMLCARHRHDLSVVTTYLIERRAEAAKSQSKSPDRSRGMSRRASSSYAQRLRTTPTTPSKPVQNSAREEGSGVTEEAVFGVSVPSSASS